MTNCQPADCPCFCPSAALPLASILVPEGGPGTVVQVPIFGTQPFQVSITLNPLYPIAQVPIVASVQIVGGNTLLITTGIPAVNETLGSYAATLRICNPCGELIISVPIEVVADLSPVVSDCALAQGVWTFENRAPGPGDTVLSFTPAGCRALLPPSAFAVCAALQSFPPAPPAPLDTVFGNQGGNCVQFPISGLVAPANVCLALNAIAPLGGALAPTDQFVILRAGGCGLATLTDVSIGFDICTALQNLPNAVVQPTAVFYGQQGGNCFEFAVSDLFGLIGAVPLLAANGSCIAPSYSFTASPDSGMFYTGTAVRIGDDNCTDFIEVGASINITSTTSNVLISANIGAFLVNASSVGINGTTGVGLTSTGGSIQLVASVGQVGLFAGGGFLVNANILADIALQFGADFRVQSLVGPTDRLRIDGDNGEWQINGSTGLATQVLTSQGPGLPPVWQAGGSAFPLLAPNGSCLAPSYSFTASPDSGMFYTGTAVRIGDDGCTDFIEVGASINIQSAGAVSVLGTSVNVSTAGLLRATFTSIGTFDMVGAAGFASIVTTNAVVGTNLILQPGQSTGVGNKAPDLLLAGGTRVDGDGGHVLITGSNGLGVNRAGGRIELNAGESTGTALAGNVVVDCGVNGSSAAFSGSFRVLTHGIGRLTIAGDGEWLLQGLGGAVGQQITSNGVGLPPTWQAAVPAGAFPLLAPDGSCAAPSYSFTSSPDSGMFYTGTAVRIGDDNCTDFIEVGASINMQSAGAVSVLGTSATIEATGNIRLESQGPGGDIRLNAGGGVTPDALILTFNPQSHPVIGSLLSLLTARAGGAVMVEGAAGGGAFPGGGQAYLFGGHALNPGATSGGSATVSGGWATGVGNVSGDAIVAGGRGDLGALDGGVRLRTGLVQRLFITRLGEWTLSGTPGAAGEQITSNGVGLPPTWQAAVPAGAFPLLAPDGSCAAPSYSFTSSPDSGMFYDAGAGAVIIGDDNCTDFLSIGASVELFAATSTLYLHTGGSAPVTIQGAGGVSLSTGLGSGAAIAIASGSGAVIGGAVTISAGPGGTGGGGTTTVTGGTAVANGQPGGPVNISGGAGLSGGSNSGGGFITCSAGLGGGGGGGLTLGGGVTNVLNAAGGSITVAGGSNTNGLTVNANGGGVSILGGGGFGTGAPGAVAIAAGGSTGTGVGGAITITSGDAAATANGGAMTLAAGRGGLTSGSGGDATLRAGHAGVSGAGGDLTLMSGFGAGSGNGGTLLVVAGPPSGTATGNGGNLILRGGINGNAPGTPGTVTVEGGTSQTAAAGGAVTIQGGPHNTIGAGGAVIIQGGSSTSGNGGAVTVSGRVAAGTNKTGGQATISGGNSTGTATGGAVVLTGGAGGATSGSGGAVTLQGGAATGTNAAGGGLQLFGSSGNGTGAGGGVSIGAGDAAATGASAGNVEIFAGLGTGGAANGGSILINAGSAAGAGADGFIALIPANGTSNLISENNGLSVGRSDLITTSTEGFPFIPGVAGAPTGALVPPTGFVGMVYDTTNQRLYIRSGGTWRSTLLA